MMALALGAGQSLRQALELAARDCGGPLGHELARALTRARRERGLDEREALVQVARESGEPHFARFAELLAAKESPYLDFLRTHATQARSEQNRLLEQAGRPRLPRDARSARAAAGGVGADRRLRLPALPRPDHVTQTKGGTQMLATLWRTVKTPPRARSASTSAAMSSTG